MSEITQISLIESSFIIMNTANILKSQTLKKYFVAFPGQ